MEYNYKLKLHKGIKKYKKKIVFFDIWNVDTIKKRELFKIRDNVNFVRQVFICILRRYPTEEELETYMQHLNQKRLSRKSLIQTIQGYDEAKQYSNVKLMR